ncbi:prolyl oligopeptidase family serine peptidase [Epilithonimonas sp. JDS]|uniref:alpha/beta hydrolase family protein n=1 Tax=Epilithonimonas sp. JDS TaxID=2902797 RepID=UPI001E33CEB7|nr:prolyl oligopeptidase family serine peptidase [Epilithonimonas sp. JDS]MCD9855769.1 prolyl oligopeptidase family serine peptidase [Epilithonimonas sp. JDS]
MMATRLFFLLFFLIQGICHSQNLDSLNSVYRRYYETAMLAGSPGGEYVVLNHTNTYGRNDYELFDVKNNITTMLGNYDRFQFLSNDLLLMRNNENCRFLNLKTGQYQEVSGNYVVETTKQSDQVVLYNTSLKELLSVSVNGKILWRQQDVGLYQLDDNNNQLFYSTGNNLCVRNLKSHVSKTFKLNDNIQWLSSKKGIIYGATIEPLKIELYTIDMRSEQITKQLIAMPESFESAVRLTTLLEVREGDHFIFPMHLKSKVRNKENPDLRITYSNKNSNNKVLYHHLGIYNIKDEKWDYLPDMQDELPVYKFLNDKGDFAVYDQGDDTVEEQQNSIYDINLILDYGKYSYTLPNKRIEDGNYLWDRETEQFIYFDDKTWMAHNIKTGKNIELLPSHVKGLESLHNSGLVKSPVSNPIKIKGRSAIMISNQYDYFLLDLKTLQFMRVTNGEEEKIKYQLQLSKDKYPKSSLNIRLAEINLENDLLFKMFNKVSYDSGFASYSHKNNKITFYRKGHYRELLTYKNGIYLISNFALEPFRLTKFEKGKYSIVYESLKNEKKDFEGSKYQIFQYSTDLGISNAALLFPVNYNPKKKYPLIVNIYEEISHDILYFLQPYLTIMVGFNYMHYLMNGYMILLPDLQYNIGNVKNSVVTSLVKSIDTAKLFASIDEKNIGIIGLSYGGYETGLALTNSNYFKTGVAGVMISDLVSHALSQSENMAKPNYMRTENQQMRMKSNVLDDWKLYLENSPLYHLKNIEVPILLWSGLKDKNVSPAQTKAFFLGMKRQGKKAVLLEYNNEGHNVILPFGRLDLNVKIWQWFDYYLKNRTPADWIVPAIP